MTFVEFVGQKDNLEKFGTQVFIYFKGGVWKYFQIMNSFVKGRIFQGQIGSKVQNTSRCYNFNGVFSLNYDSLISERW